MFPRDDKRRLAIYQRRVSVDSRPASELQWRQGRRCNGGQCVEVAGLEESVVLRSSTVPDGLLRLSRDEWVAFLSSVKDGLFDSL
jgi:Domain of unknown function (DUF397)